MADQVQWQLSGDYFENCNCSVEGGRPSTRDKDTRDLTWVSWTKLCERMSLERS